MLTKTSLAPARQPVDRSTAWTGLLANLLVLPGLGSCIVGKVMSGVLQIIMALAGFVFTTLWVVSFSQMWLSMQELPENVGPDFTKALVGFILFLVAWFWALGSSIAILRKSAPRP